MKFALVFLVILPLAFATDIDKQGVMHFLGLHQLSDVIHVSNLVQDILNKFGNDINEQRCETFCHQVMVFTHVPLPRTICTPVCGSVHNLAGMLNLHPRP